MNLNAPLYDAELELKASGSVSSSTNETAVTAFTAGASAVFALSVTALDTSDSDETYSFKVEYSTDGSSYSTLWDFGAVTAVTSSPTQSPRIQIPEDTTHVRAVSTLAGTTPSTTYGMYVGA